MEKIDLSAIEQDDLCTNCQKTRTRSRNSSIWKKQTVISVVVLCALTLYLTYSDRLQNSRLRDAEARFNELQYKLDVVLERQRNIDVALERFQNDDVVKERRPMTNTPLPFKQSAWQDLNALLQQPPIDNNSGVTDLSEEGDDVSVDDVSDDNLISHANQTETLKNILLNRTKRAQKEKRNKKDKQKNGNNRKRRSRRCKTCLPSIQVEGTAGPQSNLDKTDQESFWTVSSWADMSDNRYFSAEELDSSGHLHIKRDGVYMVYAQMTLIGCAKQGFHINVRTTPGSGHGSYVLATCYRNHNIHATCNTHELNNDTCQTVRLARLTANDRVYLEESTHNSGADYSNTTSFFGLIRMTLSGQSKRGYRVLTLRSSQETKELATCTTSMHSHKTDKHHDPVSCFTMRIVKLSKKDSLFIREMNSNTGAYYEGTTTYFGAVLIGAAGKS